MKEYSFSLQDIAEFTVGKNPALYYFIALLLLEMLIINIGLSDCCILFELAGNIFFIIPIIIRYFYCDLSEDKARYKDMLREVICLIGMFLTLPAIIGYSILNMIQLGWGSAVCIVVFYLFVLQIYRRVLHRFVFNEHYRRVVSFGKISHMGNEIRVEYTWKERLLRYTALFIMGCVIFIIAILLCFLAQRQ